MALGCGTTCMKYILFAFNFCFFLCGGAILGVSIWLQVDSSAQEYFKILNYDENSNLMEVTLILLTVVGAVIFLVGFLGCCGSCKESSCMLCTYAFLLIVVLLLQVVGAILAIVFQSELDEELQTSMQKLVREDVRSGSDNWKDTYTLAYNSLQYELKCCGAADYRDYRWSTQGYGENATSNEVVPPTCCKISGDFDKDEPVVPDNANRCYDEASSWTITNTTQQLYEKGCYTAMKDWLEDKAVIVIGVAFGLVAFEILCVIFACCVRSAIKEDY